MSRKLHHFHLTTAWYVDYCEIRSFSLVILFSVLIVEFAVTLRAILQTKGSAVFTTKPTETLAVVVKELIHHQCGSLLVCQGEQLVGIITERDILRASAAEERTLDSTTVEELMSTDLVTGTPDDSISETMGLLTEKRIRHLPILENNQLVGVISIGDVVKAQYAKLSIENHYLKAYIRS